MLFDVESFPIATINAVLSDNQGAVLEVGGALTESLAVNISLHGKTVSKTATVSVSTSGGEVRVTKIQPVVITAAQDNHGP